MPNDIADPLVALLPRLLRFARALSRSRDQAEDLVQAACERALAAAAGPAADAPFDAWMLTIVRNLWIDGLRRANPAGPTLDIDEFHDLPAPGPGPEDALAGRAELAQVQAAIDTLPDEQREVLWLVCIEDLSYRDTATALGIPIGTVMSRLSRAREQVARRSLRHPTSVTAANGAPMPRELDP